MKISNLKTPRTISSFNKVIDVEPRGVKALREKTIIPLKHRSKLENILISPEAIRQRVKELAKEIAKDYKSGVYMVVTLKGAVVFFSDLIRELTMLGVNVDFDYVSAKSYIGDKSSGKLEIRLDVEENIKDKKILIIEDIVDTGFTLIHLIHHFKKKGAKSVKICSLMNKPERRKLDVKINYLGFNIPNLFVVGYGLDYDEYGRGFPFVAALKESVCM